MPLALTVRRAAAMGCSEFGSDCGLANEESLRFHLALGFEEAGRISCFRRDLRPRGGGAAP